MKPRPRKKSTKATTQARIVTLTRAPLTGVLTLTAASLLAVGAYGAMAVEGAVRDAIGLND